MHLHVYVNLDVHACRCYTDSMKADSSNTTVRAWARLVKAHRVALASIEKALKAADLPPLGWYDALLELERAGSDGLRPFELEREMLLAQSNLSRLVDRIEKVGYIERRACEDDGRGQVLAITRAGKELRRRMWVVYRVAIQAAFGNHLSDKETRTLDALLGRLIDKSMVS
jgi:DNA-binding MarR family transcriptional regulator